MCLEVCICPDILFGRCALDVNVFGGMHMFISVPLDIEITGGVHMPGGMNNPI
jgi:hypothetical protein